MLARLIAFARGLLHRSRIDREVDDEVRFHLDREIEANLARGLLPAAARRKALADLGGVSHTIESVREVRSIGFDRLRSLVRDAVRGLLAGRRTTVLAFVILSLTMAAGTVTFSVIDAVALRPLPYAAPGRLVAIGTMLPGNTLRRLSAISPQDYFTLAEGGKMLASVGASRFTGRLTLNEGGAAEALATVAVTASLFDVLGVRPALGRFFGPEHERPGGPAAVVIGHDLWVRRFHADPDVVGRRLAFSDGPREVLGVLPEGVWYPIGFGPETDLYIPNVVTPQQRTDGRGFSMLVVGRLRAGSSVQQVVPEVSRLAGAMVRPLEAEVVGSAKTWLMLVLAAVGFVLLVACVNVASLLLSRATVRAREFATREALGASRRRLAAGLLLEGLILALSSAAAAISVSTWGVKVAISTLPPLSLTRVSQIAIDGRVMGVSIATAVLCGLAFGSAPAWLASRGNLFGIMKSGGGAIIGGHRRDRSLGAFLVAEVSLVCVLLVASTLVIATFIIVTTRDLGFDRRNLVAIDYQRSLRNVSESDRPAAAVALRREVLDRVKTVPGVEDAAVAWNGSLPLSGGHVSYSITLPDGRETPRGENFETNMVTPNYFRVMGIQLLRGRGFAESDTIGTPAVMLINDVAARGYFQDQDPIGKVATLFGPTTIVGVLRGMQRDGPEADVRPELYLPIDQYPAQFIRTATWVPGSLVVRTRGDARLVASGVQQAIEAVLKGEPAIPGLPPQTFQPRFIDDYFQRLTASRRFNAALMTMFGLVAVAIGALGVYGTMAFFVAQQIRAIGLRMALGAAPARVMRTVLWDALRRVALGVAIGLGLSWAASSAFSSFVFGIRPNDPKVYLAVAGILVLVGFLAALVPALRASRLDPLASLRHE